MARPHRWDEPFGPEMTDADVEYLLKRPEIAAIQADHFPPTIPVAGILENDTRIVRYKSGDIVVREGDYGNSAFLVLEGKLRVVISPDLPRELLGRQVTKKKNLFESLAQLWTNRIVPEVRDMDRYAQKGLRQGSDAVSTRVFLQDIPAILDAHKTAVLDEGSLFGELAALGRVPRTASVFAETDATCLEIRWQGLRELRKYDEGWRRKIDERYRQNALRVHLSETPLFSGLSEGALQEIADHTLFETYGSFDWNISYKKLRSEGKVGAQHEPIIARQGDYPDGLLMIRAGFARVSIKYGHGDRTLTYLGKGEYFGFDELYTAWRQTRGLALQTSLTALGYVDVLRVPSQILEKYVFPKIEQAKRPIAYLAARPLTDDALLEWAVEERFINATHAMLIDLDKCVRCDDCVRACASTHGGNPRFLRHGKTFDHWMVANACMHCVDPVCMIGCPTGAIHRTIEGGIVVINDDTCIGCATCANSCPYDNIRMVEIRDGRGNPVRDPESQNPIVKATKCDLCATQLGGPACVRACPHDALMRTDFHAAMAQIGSSSK
jgi:Fe-S-cluster-containing dehydrogenase component/CRP-like cAMP-binding protein